MSQDHAALVSAAQSLFGGQVVADFTYEDWQKGIFALIAETWGHLPPREKIDNAYRQCYRGFCGPRRAWWERLETVIQRYENDLEKAGKLNDKT